MKLYKVNNYIVKSQSVFDAINKVKLNDIVYKYLSEEAKKLKEELGLYRPQPGSHESKGLNPIKLRKVNEQTKEYNECINEAIKHLSEGELSSKTWNRLSLKMNAWKNSSDYHYLYEKSIRAIRRFEKFIKEVKR